MPRKMGWWVIFNGSGGSVPQGLPSRPIYSLLIKLVGTAHRTPALFVPHFLDPRPHPRRRQAHCPSARTAAQIATMWLVTPNRSCLNRDVRVKAQAVTKMRISFMPAKLSRLRRNRGLAGHQTVCIYPYCLIFASDYSFAASLLPVHVGR
jgi:hypothetical protein